MAAPEPVAAPVPAPESMKPIHSLVVDTGPLIKNDPLPTVLREKAEKLYTLPSVISEIRDEATRSRVETTLLPFLELRNPKADSIAFVTGFARKTGDLAVISKTDLQLIALAYELECERNGGDWRLRSTPGQKRTNGKAPGAPDEEQKEDTTGGEEGQEVKDGEVADDAEETAILEQEVSNLKVDDNQGWETVGDKSKPNGEADNDGWETVGRKAKQEEDDQGWETVPAKPKRKGEAATVEKAPLEPIAQDTTVEPGTVPEADSDSDEDGWITPSNLHKQRAQDSNEASTPASRPVTLQAALLTSDYAMQNVALRMNLNLLSPSLMRITRLKTWILRCHGCFTTTKDMHKQFCPSCGQPTLIRTSCSTDERGNFRIHLKKNFQFNKRGNVYSVPKPTHGTPNGRATPKGTNAGGKGGWGRELMLAEDQKEYMRRGEEQKRARQKDLMDEDRLPDILTGARKGDTGKIRIGAGRGINSKKR